MRPFNIDLYVRSAEKALRRIREATGVDEDGLRAFAAEELEDLKRRYRHNGYIGMQPDQKEARARPDP